MNIVPKTKRRYVMFLTKISKTTVHQYFILEVYPINGGDGLTASWSNGNVKC